MTKGGSAAAGAAGAAAANGNTATAAAAVATTTAMSELTINAPAHDREGDDDDDEEDDEEDEEDDDASDETAKRTPANDDDDDDDDDDEAASRTSNVDLGFLVVPYHPAQLLREQFPSKAGGRPAWLNPRNLPSAALLTCQHCNDPLTFLLQLYSPMRDTASTFHRTLFVFVCRKPQCFVHGKPPSVVCVRSQLPLHNAFYPPKPAPEPERPSDDDDDDDEFSTMNEDDPSEWSAIHICRVCGLPAPSSCAQCKRAHYCSRSHQKLDWQSGHKTECAAWTRSGGASSSSSSSSSATSSTTRDLTAMRRSVLFPCYEVVIEAEPAASAEDDAAATTSTATSSSSSSTTTTATPTAHEQELLARYEKEQRERTPEEIALDAEDDDADWDELSRIKGAKKDKTFERFRKCIQRAPEQVVRYERGAESPLWVCTSNQLANSNVPCCDACGGARQFEFQIMPQVLYYLQPVASGAGGAGGASAAATAAARMRDELEFATIAVYTCAQSCGNGESAGYAREFVHVQHYDEPSHTSSAEV